MELVSFTYNRNVWKWKRLFATSGPAAFLLRVEHDDPLSEAAVGGKTFSFVSETFS